MWIVFVWFGLVVLFAWFGRDVGPRRVFKALGYATLTLVVPVIVIVGGVGAIATYTDSKQEHVREAQAVEDAERYKQCVIDSEKAAASAKAAIMSGKNVNIVSDLGLLRELNGCPE